MVKIKKPEKTPRFSAAGVFLFCVVILTGFTCCMPSVPATLTYSPPFYVRDVPFYPGEDYQCGPSVLAGVLNNLGYDIAPEDISREIYLRKVKGTLNIDMVSFARRLEDITVTEFYGDLTLLRENLSMGYPLIVFVDLGIWSIRKGHYMLVVGYDDSIGGVIVYSGAEKDKVIGYKEFMRMWERGGYWALRIARAGQILLF